MPQCPFARPVLYVLLFFFLLSDLNCIITLAALEQEQLSFDKYELPDLLENLFSLIWLTDRVHPLYETISCSRRFTVTSSMCCIAPPVNRIIQLTTSPQAHRRQEGTRAQKMAVKLTNTACDLVVLTMHTLFYSITQD